MVLEGAAAPSDSSRFADEQVPLSDGDRYADQQTSGPGGRASRYSFNPDVVDLGLLASQTTEDKVKAMLQQQCDTVQGVINRPLTQTEADVLAGRFASAYKFFLYGGPVGAAAATGMFWTRIGSERGEKAQQRMLAIYERLPGMKSYLERLGTEAAQRSTRFTILALRASGWASVGWVVGNAVFGAIGTISMDSTMKSDPRLEEVTNALRQLSRARAPAQPNTTTTTTQPETFEQRRQRTSVQDRVRVSQTADSGSAAAAASARPRAVDDASPTGGAFEADFLDSVTESRPWNGDDTMDRNSQSRPGPRSAENAPQRATSSEYSTSTSSSSTSSQAANAGNGSADRPSGSAWERLRQEALGGKNGSGST